VFEALAAMLGTVGSWFGGGGGAAGGGAAAAAAPASVPGALAPSAVAPAAAATPSIAASTGISSSAPMAGPSLASAATPTAAAPGATLTPAQAMANIEASLAPGMSTQPAAAVNPAFAPVNPGTATGFGPAPAGSTISGAPVSIPPAQAGFDWQAALKGLGKAGGSGAGLSILNRALNPPRQSAPPLQPRGQGSAPPGPDPVLQLLMALKQRQGLGQGV
jgi:hypothetical protein